MIRVGGETVISVGGSLNLSGNDGRLWVNLPIRMDNALILKDRESIDCDAIP